MMIGKKSNLSEWIFKMSSNIVHVNSVIMKARTMFDDSRTIMRGGGEIQHYNNKHVIFTSDLSSNRGGGLGALLAGAFRLAMPLIMRSAMAAPRVVPKVIPKIIKAGLYRAAPRATVSAAARAAPKAAVSSGARAVTTSSSRQLATLGNRQLARVSTSTARGVTRGATSAARAPKMGKLSKLKGKIDKMRGAKVSAARTLAKANTNKSGRSKAVKAGLTATGMLASSAAVSGIEQLVRGSIGQTIKDEATSQALQAGLNLVRDRLDGKNLKESLKREGKKMRDRLAQATGKAVMQTIAKQKRKYMPGDEAYVYKRSRAGIRRRNEAIRKADVFDRLLVDG